GWESPTAIVSRDIGGYPGYHLAIDNLGRVMAIWTQIYNQHHDTQIATSRYLPGEGWTTPAVITPTKLAFLDTTSPYIAVDNTGNAMAVWIQYDYPTGYVWANRFDSERGWGEAQRIDSQQLWDATYPKVAMDDQGNAVAVWSQDDNRFIRNIRANHYLANAGWGHDRLLEENNTGDAERPQVGIDGTGQATVVWAQRDGVRNAIWTNRYR
ncbi:MAG: hypothetical protein FD130_1922, partial [Halothiobacillaceae bacterium]